MKRKRITCTIVELALDPSVFPDHAAFISLVARLPELGTLKCIELGIAPQGGGRLAFVVDGAPAREGLRERLRSLVGEDAILSCIARRT